MLTGKVIFLKRYYAPPKAPRSKTIPDVSLHILGIDPGDMGQSGELFPVDRVGSVEERAFSIRLVVNLVALWYQHHIAGSDGVGLAVTHQPEVAFLTEDEFVTGQVPRDGGVF